MLLFVAPSCAAAATTVGGTRSSSADSYHLDMAHDSLRSLFGSLPATTVDAIADDPMHADPLFEHDPDYIEFTRHIRDHRNQWFAGQRRRAQQDGWLVNSPIGGAQGATIVAHMTAAVQRDETADPEAIFADDQRVSAELQRIKDDVAAPRTESGGGAGAGVAPFDHLQSVFSRERCHDALAENNGEVGVCSYSCATLEQHFFPPGGPLGPMAHCFLYNAQTRLWSDSAGGPDLMTRKKTSMEWFEFLPPTPAAQGGPPLSFTIGDGPVCRNVTVQMMTRLGPSGAVATTETRCLMDGYHEHLHAEEAGSFQVVGHDGACS